MPGRQAVSEIAALVKAFVTGSLVRRHPDRRAPVAPRTPLNGPITAHRRFAFGSLPLDEVKVVKNHFGMTVNDVVMALTPALRRWLLDHDALPRSAVVVAVPVSIRTEDQTGARRQPGLGDAGRAADPPRRRRGAPGVRPASRWRRRSEPSTPCPPRSCRTSPTGDPTALSGLAARALFKLVTVPGSPFNLFVCNVPGPQLPLYIAGARVLGVYPVSAVTDMTGGLNITLLLLRRLAGLRPDRLPGDGPGRVEPDRLPARRDRRAGCAGAPEARRWSSRTRS